MLLKHARLIPALIALLVVCACSGKKNQPAPRPPSAVLVASATQQDVPVLLKAIGNVEASESVIIKPLINGEVVRVGFREGQDVRRGDVLFVLDQRSRNAALKKAEAALARNQVIMANAKANYERYRQLVKEGIVTPEQAESYRTTAESAEANVAADRAELESARVQLSHCTIKAPTSGRLGVLAVHRGNIVKENETALVTINRIVPAKVLFSIPEKDMPAIKQRMQSGRLKVEAEVSGAGGFKESGLVDFIDNTVDAATGTIKLKGLFENRLKRLWPGQLVSISITLDTIRDATVVPTQAIQTGQQGLYVLVVGQDLTAAVRPVKTSTAYQGFTVIESGLNAGEQVVTEGQVRVKPGAKVEIKPGAGTQDTGSASDHKSRSTDSGARAK
ncbi:MAG TPA: efflux RND transporter periplasmic adaptor subunit [Deltaproteobacteria bacterium]|nr:efflux RND transporter periplasmic adaptor subunit [Deltaproteobacteria bacterium]HQB39769.1 efflux RND transporter periplasmic adaptor subunit [Deltaproteobacteria bacterium]